MTTALAAGCAAVVLVAIAVQALWVTRALNALRADVQDLSRRIDRVGLAITALEWPWPSRPINGSSSVEEEEEDPVV